MASDGGSRRRRRREHSWDEERSPFPDEVLEHVLAFVKSPKDRSAVSLVSKRWYEADRWSRRSVFIGNCYAVSPDILVRRFPNITSVALKGKPRFSDFNLVPQDWGAHIQSWLLTFASAYPFLEELRLKRMTLSDESLEFLARMFPGFKALSLVSCDGFSTCGLASIATHCRDLRELDIQENGIEDTGGSWLSCFPESFTSLEVLNFANLSSKVSFDALEGLVTRCKSLRVLKVNRNVSLDQLQRLVVRAPLLTELGTGTISEELSPKCSLELENAFNSYSNLRILSGLWQVSPTCISSLYAACRNLTFLNLSYACLQGSELANLLPNCPLLRRLWVLDTVEDKGLEAVGGTCHLLEEIRVFPVDPFEQDIMVDGVESGVSESGFVAVSAGCPNLRYVLYFCRSMTNAAVCQVVNNCPNFTHFRLCVMNPHQPDHLTGEPMDEAFGCVARRCTKLRRLSVSGLLTDRAFQHIGHYAKNLETLSVAFAGRTDRGMQFVLEGCPKLRKLEIRDCPFGDSALLSGWHKYESMKSLWMSACTLTMDGCRLLAREVPRLNVEVIREDGSSDVEAADKVYVYRSIAGPRTDTPPFVVTL